MAREPSTALTALKILSSHVVPEKIDVEAQDELISHVVGWPSNQWKLTDGEALDDEETFDALTEKFNSDLAQGSFLPIPVTHRIYREAVLPSLAAALIAERGARIFGIDYATARVVAKAPVGAYTTRIFWLHNSPKAK